MANQFDTRQVENKSGALNQLTGTDTTPGLNVLLSEIEKELTPPFALRASSPNDRVVNVGSNKITNSTTGRSKLFGPLAKSTFTFTSGTVTFPASSGGTVTVSPGTNNTLTLTSGFYIKALIQISSGGNMTVVFGTEGATEAAATFPTFTGGNHPIGYVTVRNIGGTIQNISDSNIYQFSTGPYGSTVEVGDGSASLPSLTFINDPNTGFYSEAADRIGVSVGGTLRASFYTDKFMTTVPLMPNGGTVGAPSHSFSGDQDTGMYSDTGNQLDFATGAVQRLSLNSSRAKVTVPFYQAAGTNAAPIYSFDADPDTGMYSDTANQLDFTTGGTQRFSLNSTRAKYTVPFHQNSGSNTAPVYSFDGDDNTGMYRIAADRLGFAAGGTAKFEVNSTQVNIGADAIGNTAGYQAMIAGDDAMLAVKSTATTGTKLMIDFRDGANTQVGAISSDTAANTTTYGTSSDSRLKNNIESFDALALIDNLNPVKYERISNPGPKEYGFLAQELHTVLPQAVIEGGQDPDQNPWQVDYGKVTAVLCKAIKELKEQNEELLARLEALENQ